MKKILLLIAFMWGVAQAQTVGQFRYDTTKFLKVGGRNHVMIENMITTSDSSYKPLVVGADGVIKKSSYWPGGSGGGGSSNKMDTVYRLNDSTLRAVKGADTWDIDAGVQNTVITKFPLYVNGDIIAMAYGDSLLIHTIRRGDSLISYRVDGDSLSVYAPVGGGGGSGTVTSVATNTGTGITGGTITTTGTIAADTASVLGTKAWSNDRLGAKADTAALVKFFFTGLANDDLIKYDAANSRWINFVGGSSSGSLSGLTAATATNDISNANYKQTWNWPTLAADTGFSLRSNNTTAASNTQTLFSSALLGANATASQKTTAAAFNNTKTGTTNTNVAAYFNASGATNNYAGIFDGGFVGINTTAPTTPLHVNGTSATNPQARIGSFEFQSLSVNNNLFTENMYYNSGFKRRATGFASYLQMQGQEMTMNVAASGAANSAITAVIPFKVNLDGTVALGNNISNTVGTYAGSTMTVTSLGAQIGKNGAAPVASALLELSSTSKGFLMPRATNAQIGSIASPATGLMMFDTDINRPKVYSGSWEALSVNAPKIVKSGSVVGGVATVTVASYTTGAIDSTFNIQARLNITAVSVNTIEMRVIYTDELNISRTISFYPMGATNATLGTTGLYSFPVLGEIRVKASTTISVDATMIATGGTMTYNAGATIIGVR